MDSIVKEAVCQRLDVGSLWEQAFIPCILSPFPGSFVLGAGSFIWTSSGGASCGRCLDTGSPSPATVDISEGREVSAQDPHLMRRSL